jgi:hypothetical protein
MMGTEWGSSPPFGTIRKLKGITASRRSPFFRFIAQVSNKWLWWRVCETACGYSENFVG